MNKKHRLRNGIDERNRKMKRQSTIKSQLAVEQRVFDNKANRPFRWRDCSREYSIFQLSGRKGIRKGSTNAFYVILDRAIPFALVDSKLNEVFGDLNGDS